MRYVRKNLKLLTRMPISKRIIDKGKERGVEAEAAELVHLYGMGRW